MAENQDFNLPDWIDVAEIQGEERILLKTTEAAVFFDISSRTLQRYHKQGCPKYKRGWWDIKEIRKWLNQEAEDNKLESRKLKAEIEYKEAQAKLKEKELEISEGDYIEKEEVKSQWIRRVIEVKKGLLALPQKIASQITDPKTRSLVEGVCEDEVIELLEQYARKGEHTPT